MDTVGRVPPARLSGIFAALPLTSLNLASNGFGVLPDGILTGLSNLATLDLGGNTVDPLPVIVTLERVARAEFKAAIPAGAPFAATVPVTVTGGTLDGTPATVTVAAGERDSSGTCTVTPSDPRNGAVDVTVGALPAIPSGHSGYVLQASADLPLTVVVVKPITTQARRPGVRTPRPVPERVSGTGNAACPRSIQEREGEEETGTTAPRLWTRSGGDVPTCPYGLPKNPSPGCSPGSQHRPGRIAIRAPESESTTRRFDAHPWREDREGRRKNQDHRGPFADPFQGRRFDSHPSV